MTRKPDLGVVLAVVGGAVVVAAVVAGFIAIGGPGDARARRLDEMKTTHMHQIAQAAQCAYSASGRIPESLAEAKTVLDTEAGQKAPLGCEYIDAQAFDTRSITYSRSAADTIELCADFARATFDDRVLGETYGPFGFPALNERRAGPGRHCYSVKLVRLGEDGAPLN